MLIAITIATKINSSSFGLDSSNDKKKGINANIAIKTEIIPYCFRLSKK